MAVDQPARRINAKVAQAAVNRSISVAQYEKPGTVHRDRERGRAWSEAVSACLGACVNQHIGSPIGSVAGGAWYGGPPEIRYHETDLIIDAHEPPYPG